MFAISSKQPRLCAQLLAARLSPSGSGELAAEAAWIGGFDSDAVASATAPASDGLKTFSAPTFDAKSARVPSPKAEALSTKRLVLSKSSFANLPKVLPTDADGRRAVAKEAQRQVGCLPAEAALLLLSACHDSAIDALLVGAETAEAKPPPPPCPPSPAAGSAPPPPSHPPPPQPPPRALQLAFVIHSTVLFRLHGRSPLVRPAGHVLSRLVSMSDTRRPCASRSRQGCYRFDTDSESQAAQALIDSLLPHGVGGGVPHRSSSLGTTAERPPAVMSARAPPLLGPAGAEAGAAEDGENGPHALEAGPLVEGLLRIVGKRVGGSLCEGWSESALRHGSQPAALGGAEAEASLPGALQGAHLQRASLIAYRAMVPMLSSDLLQPHVTMAGTRTNRCETAE